jgi:hypothetical protein
MHPFANGICLWILGSSGPRLNAMTVQHELEIMAQKLTARIMDAIQGSRIPSKPSIFKMKADVCSGGIVNTNNFHQVGHHINDGERVKTLFLTSNRYGPGSNEIHDNISPRQHSSFSSGCLTMPAANILEPLTRITPSNLVFTGLL